MITKTGESLILETSVFVEDVQLNGPFVALRDLDMKALLQEYLETLADVTSTEELEVRSKAMSIRAKDASYQHHAVNEDHPSVAFVV